MAESPEAQKTGERPLIHICEVCGVEEIITPSEAFNGGWDYPPRMGHFGVISPRTCGSCPMDGTVYWALMFEKKSVTELSDSQLKVIECIQAEPESILPKEAP